MKDDKLEKEFEEYFKGVNISDEIVADAKKSVERKRNNMPKIAKILSIAASIVLVFAVSLAVILKTDFNSTSGGGNSSASGDNSQAPDWGDNDSSQAPESPDYSGGSSGDGEGDSSSGAVRFEYYTDDDLEKTDADVYSISSLDSSLKLIEKFAYASNTSVESCKAAYMDDKLAIVIAKVNILSGLTRDETTVYVEFTQKNTIYGELADYYKTYIRYYKGNEYYLTETEGENGEPEFKLHILYDSVKYYFNVHSSDIKAYEKYLDMVIK